MTQTHERDEDSRFMRLALEEAKKCTSEDNEVRPKVGAVLVRDGKVQAAGYRGLWIFGQP